MCLQVEAGRGGGGGVVVMGGLWDLIQMLVARGSSLPLFLLQPLQKPDLRRHLVAASDTNRAETTNGSKCYSHFCPLNYPFLPLFSEMDLL